MPLPPGARIARYELAALLGAGSQGTVYEAMLQGPSGFRKRVAIKLTEASDTSALLREGKLGAMIRHTNVVDVYEVGRADDGGWFMAMELVDGPSVQQLLRRGPLPGRALVEIGAQVASGLSAAHKAGLVHRDVKPSNLLVSADGQVKVSDLGITAPGADAVGGAGTRGYRAPEQIDRKPLDGRADVFALGVCLWEMATGTTPLVRATASETANATRKAAELAAQPSVQAALEAAVPGLGEVIVQCVQREPEDRPPSARDLRRRLNRLRPRESEGLVEVLSRHEATNEWEVVTLQDPAEPPTEPDDGLPPEGRPVIGRQREQAALMRQLAERAPRVTLKGMPGIGKTRLALRAAHQLENRGEVVLWASLHGESEPLEVLTRVARLVGLQLDGTGPDAQEEQVGLALAAVGRLVLVLDGVDVQGPELAASIDRWSAHTPDLVLLCTAHGPVGFDGEVVLDIGALPLEDGIALLEQVSQSAGRLAPETQRAVVEAVDGIPLGIELAASNLAQTAPDAVLDRLGAATEGTPLDQAIAVAVGRLEPWARAALAQLSVFHGRFPLDAATAVLDLQAWPRAPWAVDVVQSLWRRSLLTLRQREDEPEVALLGAVRAHARSLLLDSEHEAAARTAHGAWFARLGDPQALARLSAPGGVQRFRELVDATEDLLAALRHARAVGDADLAVPLSLALAEITVRQGPFQLGLEHVDAALELDPTRPERAALLLARIRLLDRMERTDAVEAALDAAEAAARGRPALLALVSLARANAALHSEDTRSCARAARLAMRRARAAGDPSCVAGALRVLGVAKREQGQIDDAEALLLRARAIYEGLGDDAGVGGIDQSLGLLYRGMGRMDEAIERHELSIRAQQRTGHRGAVAVAQHALGVVHFLTQDFDRAEAQVRGALDRYRALGNGSGVANCRGTLASILIGRGASEDAEAELEAVATYLRANGRWRQFAVVANNLANLYTVGGHYAQAEGLYREAIDVCERAGLERLAGLPLGNLGVMLIDRGDVEAGHKALRQAIQSSHKASQHRMVAALSGEEARALLMLGQLEACGRVLDEAEAGLRAVHDRMELAKTLATRARWAWLKGDEAGAEAALAEAETLLGDNRTEDVVVRIEQAREDLASTAR